MNTVHRVFIKKKLNLPFDMYRWLVEGGGRRDRPRGVG